MHLLKSVMIIDDDEDDRNLFFEALMAADQTLHFISAPNGKEGLNILQRKDIQLPDILFLDLNMPLMNGMQCLAEIRRITQLERIPVIIYTTTQSIDEYGELTAYNPIYFLSKPTRFKEIVKAVSYLISNRWWEKAATGSRIDLLV
jgi:DNA-binding NtrC family response regulator